MHSGLFGGGYDWYTVMFPVFQVRPAILPQPPVPELLDPPELLLEPELLDPPERLPELEPLDPELPEEDDELALPPPLLLLPPPEELEPFEPTTPLDDPAAEPLLDEPEPVPPPSSPLALAPLSGVEPESDAHPPPAAKDKNSELNESATTSLFIGYPSQIGATGSRRPPLI